MKELLFIMVLIFITGCFADLDFKRPEVVSVTPSDNSTLVPTSTAVTVNFSKSMDTVRTNDAFSLSSESGAVEGIYAWDNNDKILTFTPRENLPVSGSYTIRITEEAEDSKGNDLNEGYVSKFYINGENSSPYILSYSPAADSTGNPVNTQVFISFSEPVDINTIYDGITISPATGGYFSWNAGFTEVRFTPLYGFNYCNTYTVSISESVADASGNTLREAVSFRFTVGNDFIKPSVAVYQDLAIPLVFAETVVTHGAEKNSRIVLNFSEIINTDNLRSAVTISPLAGFYINSTVIAGATTAYINFTENLDSGETYTLRISSSITDLQDNPLDKDYRFVFVIDGSGSIAPVVSTIGDLNGFPVWVMDDIQVLAIIPATPLLYPDIVVDFTAAINPLTLSIYTETVAGSGITPTVVNLNWPVFTRLRFGLYNVVAGNIYKIVIKGGTSGLRDMNGNYMKEDFVQMVRF